MKLLVFYPYIPYPLNRGAYQRTFHLLRELARDHEVDLLALSEKCEGFEHRDVFGQFCRRVEFVPFEHPPWEKLIPSRLLNPLPATVAHWRVAQAARALGAVLESGDYQAAHICDIVLAQFFLNRHQTIPLFVDRTRVDLYYQYMEHQRMRFSLRTRLLNCENFLKLWRYERAVARRAALEIVCGPDDERVVRRFVSRKVPVLVLPNGVDLEYFRSGEESTDDRAVDPTLLFCGAMDYNPNIDALRWYFGQMHESLCRRVPNLQVWIAGKDPVAEVRQYARIPRVIVTGGVPDVRPYYRRAWVQIVPLRIGGGTRLKIVESLAIKTPVVSTTIGAQGLGLRHGTEILLADTAEAFVDETARALRDPSLRMRLAEQGLAAVRSRLSWPILGRQLSRWYSTGTSSLRT